MKFFFPDSHDLVDPTFDFATERRVAKGSRHAAHRYAHECLSKIPYDGMLISKAIVDGRNKSLRYTFGQIQRLKRRGAKEFLRLDRLTRDGKAIEVMGDCGSFSFRDDPEPPFSVAEVLDFYETCGFDAGISLDHVILGYHGGEQLIDEVPKAWRERFDMTLELAHEFLKEHKREKLGFRAMGAAQGWSPRSYADAVSSLQKMGYHHIALGGMVPLKTDEILDCLHEIAKVRKQTTQLHLLGITRCDKLLEFQRLGVTSFDSTSPLMKAFMDDKENYHTPKGFYTAVRIPQTDANPKLKRAILAGKKDGAEARRLEIAALDAVTGYGNRAESLDNALNALGEYETFREGSYVHAETDRETLAAEPWKRCGCAICLELGVHVVLFRGAERNRRRGFHNLHVLRQRMNQNLV